MAESNDKRRQDTPFSTVPPWIDAITVGFVAFALRAALIAWYPLVYGGDPIIRLIESDRILISYQLPGLQCVVYLIHALGGGVVETRLAVAGLSALAAAGLTRLAGLGWSRSVGLLAGLFFACKPFCLYFSAIPYQFPLVLGWKSSSECSRKGSSLAWS